MACSALSGDAGSCAVPRSEFDGAPRSSDELALVARSRRNWRERDAIARLYALPRRELAGWFGQRGVRRGRAEHASFRRVR